MELEEKHLKKIPMRTCSKEGCLSVVWGTDKNTRKGYCKNHQYLRTDTDKRSIIQRAIAKNASKNEISKVRGLIDNSEENKRRYELEIFFKNAAIEIAKNPRCSECNTWIPKKFYRAATAHIFNKSDFKSVATNPNNYLILGSGCGCHQKTHRIDTFSTMKVFPIAIERFYLFEKEITEHHKYLDLFKEAIKNYKQ
jgi:hypothetical protein